MTDRWKDDTDDPTESQPDNPQRWHKDPPEPKKAPDHDDNPQRWHRD